MRSPRRAIVADVNVTPLIDVVLVLLIIFMAAIPLLPRGYEVVLPAAATPGKQLPTPLVPPVLELTAALELRLDGKPSSFATLPGDVAQALAGLTDRRVVFESDGDVPYATAIAAMDGVRAAGGLVALRHQP